MDTSHPELQDKLQELEHELEVSGCPSGIDFTLCLVACAQIPLLCKQQWDICDCKKNRIHTDWHIYRMGISRRKGMRIHHIYETSA